MSEFLLEILVQELPYKFIPAAQKQLKEAFEKLFNEFGIEYSSVQTLATPRRLAVIVKDLSDKQKDITKEAKGPILNIAVDANGKYTPAALGFAKKNGASEADLYQKDNYIWARVEIKGKSTKEILTESIENVIFKMQGSHFMRWGNHSEKFSRPIENVVALYNEEVLPLQILDKKSTNKTRGHRFSKIQEIEIPNAEKYIETLKKVNVIVDPIERKELIVKSATECAEKIDATINFEEDLLEEVTYITEYPIPVLCDFDEKYLEIPDIVSTTVMSKHQRYFPLWTKDGKLLNHFITMANFVGIDEESMENIKAGNQRVVSARLEDGIFFYKEDTKTPLFDKIDELKGMTFQKGLGSLYNKTERIVELAGDICKTLKIDEKDVIRAAWLSKADLSTRLVFEFTELQGFIGEDYALKSGEKPNVAKAVKEHYFPLSAYSECASETEGQIVSIADKIDTICALFVSTQGKNKKKRPTGSNDPLGARRAAIGILRTIIGNDLHIDLEKLIEISTNAISKEFSIEVDPETIPEIIEFIENRLIIMYEKEFSKEVFAAAKVQKPLKNLKTFIERAKIINELVKTDSFKTLIEAANRVLRITKGKTVDVEIDEKLFVTDAEKALYKAYSAHTEAEDDILKYANSLQALILPVNEFFEKVLVMDKDEKIKNNRIALLNALKEKFLKVCDFQYL